MTSKNENEKEKISIISLDGLLTRPRSNTCPNFQLSTQSKKLKLGSKVVILGTDNVEQRVPQYVGVEGIIIDVPVHPATWYKVQFTDGQIITFRPSALKLATDCDIINETDELLLLSSSKSLHSNQSSKHLQQNNNNNNTNISNTNKSTISITKSRIGSNNSNTTTTAATTTTKNLLSNINPDFWSSCKVKILSGKYVGEIALVKYSGNGWVQLDTPLGEVAKRATELELLEIRQAPNYPKPIQGLTISIPGSNSNSSSSSSTSVSISTNSNARRRSNSESLVISPTSRTSIISTSPRSSEKNTLIIINQQSQQIKLQQNLEQSQNNSHNNHHNNHHNKNNKVDHNNTTTNNNNNNNNSNNNHSHHQHRHHHHHHHKTNKQSNHHNHNNINQNHQSQNNNNNNNQKIQRQRHDSIGQSYQSDIDDKDSHTVLVDPKIRNLQYDYFKKYVEKEVSKVKNRPNMKYWTNQVKSTMIDEEHERSISRVINENSCSSCQMEKWPGSIVCWNELCPTSPIYWKLPGAAGTPTIPEKRYKSMENVFKNELEKRPISSIYNNYHYNTTTTNNNSNNNEINDLNDSSGNENNFNEIEPLEKKRKIQKNENITFLTEYDENERIACQILGSLSSLSPNQCFPNIVSEYLNNSPILQIHTPTTVTSSSLSTTPTQISSTSSNASTSSTTPIPSSPVITKSMLPSPMKNIQKNERSDSGATDTEDGIRFEPLRKPLILRAKSNSTNHYNHHNNNNNNNNIRDNNLLVTVPESSPLHISPLKSTSLSTSLTSTPTKTSTSTINSIQKKELQSSQLFSQSPLKSRLNNSNNNNNNGNLKGLATFSPHKNKLTSSSLSTSTGTINSLHLNQSQQVKTPKKMKNPFSPSHKGGLFIAQGNPPTQEEFERFISEHHFPSQQLLTSPIRQQQQQQQQQHLRNTQNTSLETLPLSVLTSRVDSSQRNMTELTNVTNGPPLLKSTHNNTSTIQSVYLQQHKK